jgi:hypothetical protein
MASGPTDARETEGQPQTQTQSGRRSTRPHQSPHPGGRCPPRSPRPPSPHPPSRPPRRCRVCVLTGYEDEGRERGTRATQDARRASDKGGGTLTFTVRVPPRSVCVCVLRVYGGGGREQGTRTGCVNGSFHIRTILSSTRISCQTRHRRARVALDTGYRLTAHHRP